MSEPVPMSNRTRLFVLVLGLLLPVLVGAAFLLAPSCASPAPYTVATATVRTVDEAIGQFVEYDAAREMKIAKDAIAGCAEAGAERAVCIDGAVREKRAEWDRTRVPITEAIRGYRLAVRMAAEGIVIVGDGGVTQGDPGVIVTRLAATLVAEIGKAMAKGGR